MRGSSALPEFVPKTAGSRFGAMILELKTGRKRNGGLKRIDIRETQQLSVTHKKRTSHERFVSTSGVRSEKPKLPRFGAMILELKTGRKRNGGLKVLNIRETQQLSVTHKKRTSHERFVNTSGVRSPQTQASPIWRNDFGAKNGAQAKRRVEAY